jgi:superoxide reductase
MKCEEDIQCGINQPKDKENISDLEKKHTPVIQAPDTVKKGEPFDVIVEVGKLKEHPNELDHFIQAIELYSGNTFLARADLRSKQSFPKVSFTVAVDHEHPLRAFEICNLHGTWEGTKRIKVE